MISQLRSAPNQLTLLRLIFIPFVVIAVMEDHHKTALALFVVAGISDVLDGLLARILKQQTALGLYLDPIADKLLLSTLFLALSLDHRRIPWYLTVLVFSRDIGILIVSALLYATSGVSGAEQLTLATLAGRTSIVASVPGLLDAAFAPDGSRLLTRTAAGYQVWGLSGAAAPDFIWPEDDGQALAWWAPAESKLLVRDAHGVALVDVRAHSVTQLLVTPTAPKPANASLSWAPLTSSPWSTDGASFAFADGGAGVWRGAPLPTHSGMGGLYVASAAHPAQAPALVDSGADAWPGWSALDASASLLAGA